MLYLISGYKRTGKDTLIDALLEGKVDSLGWKVYSLCGNYSKPSEILLPGGHKDSFARRIKEILCEMFHVDDIMLIDRIKDMNVKDAEKMIGCEGILEGKTIRQWLIDTATFCKEKYGKTYFSDIVYSRSQGITYICDFRFPEEYRQDAITIRLFRSKIPITLDASEVALDGFRCDYLFCLNHEDFIVACSKFPQYKEYRTRILSSYDDN